MVSIDDFMLFASENSANIAQSKILNPAALKRKFGELSHFRKSYDTFLVLCQIVSFILLHNFDIMDIMNISRMYWCIEFSKNFNFTRFVSQVDLINANTEKR